jgi:hypothetical protein
LRLWKIDRTSRQKEIVSALWREFVSIRWITKVWSDSPYDGTRLLIHLALADISHDDGRFFASQTNLASKGRCSVEYVRKVINEMIADGHLKIITKGNSRGNATVYQLIWKKLPNSVGEEQSLGEVELPNSDTPNSPTLTPSLPNSTPYHPSYTSVLSTTKSDETAIAVVALSEALLENGGRNKESSLWAKMRGTLC